MNVSKYDVYHNIQHLDTIMCAHLSLCLSHFDWGVVAKGLISTMGGSQPIAERAVGLGNHSFLHHTKQRGYANVQQKRYMMCK